MDGSVLIAAASGCVVRNHRRPSEVSANGRPFFPIRPLPSRDRRTGAWASGATEATRRRTRHEILYTFRTVRRDCLTPYFCRYSADGGASAYAPSDQGRGRGHEGTAQSSSSILVIIVIFITPGRGNDENALVVKAGTQVFRVMDVDSGFIG